MLKTGPPAFTLVISRPIERAPGIILYPAENVSFGQIIMSIHTVYKTLKWILSVSKATTPEAQD